jgi:hypothetical protein
MSTKADAATKGAPLLDGLKIGLMKTFVKCLPRYSQAQRSNGLVPIPSSQRFIDQELFGLFQGIGDVPRRHRGRSSKASGMFLGFTVCGLGLV